MVALFEIAVLIIFRPALPQDEGAPDTEPAAGIDTRGAREKAGLGFRDPSMTLHPYLGYVFLPRSHRPADSPGNPAIAISEDGFLDPGPAVRRRAADRVIIGITGGSVAGQLGTWHSKLLAEAFADVGAFAGRTPDFVFLGMPGYHQPQQAIQLSYVLAQGAEFDYVINLDGFNELAVPAALNKPQGANPLYPMNWSMVALDVPDTDLRRTIGAIDFLQSERRRRRAEFARSWWRFSPTARLFGARADASLSRSLADYTWQLQSFAPDQIPWFVTGPGRYHLPDEEMIPELVAVWKRASLQMQGLCESFGIRYLHVLQPNQYDPGSKPLSSEEKQKAFLADSPYRAVVEAGYEQLREAGRDLAEKGVAFHDLNRAFAAERATLYVDNCCHFNAAGNRVLAEKMADIIDAAF
jgi:hypothetical protein